MIIIIDKWALNAATWIKQQNPDQTASIAVLQFALIGILNSLLIFIIIIFIGAISGHLWDSFLASLFFVFLHFFSGGHHFKSALMCTIFSSCVIIVSFSVPINNDVLLAITIFTILILFVFAPSNIENHARIPKSYFPVLKMISIIIVIANLFLLNSAVALALLFQSLLVIPYSKLMLKRGWK
ncbi:accessory gene regulator B family protein [Cohnella herbarum]|uniref:Accessory gene regulator B n=1 Tax=Cohnella herbarum TaxID=2728023 RepID=A0A7Z2VQX4_9BACL|nr:accessory gene regulator B family protein [Cohnella herbarum]QJD87642.1 hypothetical protein HH215_33635 [Cohnella herbarum]